MFYDGIYFVCQQHEVTGNGSLAVPVGWKLIKWRPSGTCRSETVSSEWIAAGTVN
jgi:hypothetical protein